MIDGKQMYEFIKKYRPNDLGTAIVDYVEQLKADKQALKEQLTLTDVSQQRELLLDFWMNLPKTHKHKGVAEHYIDNYLKSNNCG